MKKSDIIEAYVTIRKENQSIPDDVLDFMKNVAISKLEIKTPTVNIGQYEAQKELYKTLTVSGAAQEFGSSIKKLANQVIEDLSNIIAPKMIPPYCQVGTLVSLKTSFLGQPIGTRCIVYHVDESGSAAIISNEGVEFGYFTESEILEHLEFLKHTKLDYSFISVIRLMEDFRQGRFDQYFK